MTHDIKGKDIQNKLNSKWKERRRKGIKLKENNPDHWEKLRIASARAIECLDRSMEV